MITITIDPGHGGSNNGTSLGAIHEKAMTLILAKDLALSFHGTKVGVELTRYDDEDMTHEARALVATKSQSRLAVLLHVNAILDPKTRLPDPKTRGLEVYALPASHAAANAFGFALAPAVTQLYGGKFRCRLISATDDPATVEDDWHKAARACLRPFTCPAVLVECGYATNQLDLAVLQDDWKRAQLISALRQAIMAALEFITAADPA